MQSIGIYEAKAAFPPWSKWSSKAKKRITRHGKEVVRMLPMRRKPVITDEQIARELEQIRPCSRR
jgi:hypothetical protein